MPPSELVRTQYGVLMPRLALALTLALALAHAPACNGAYLTEDEVAEIREDLRVAREDTAALAAQVERDRARLEQQRIAIGRLVDLLEGLGADMAAVRSALRAVRERLREGIAR